MMENKTVIRAALAELLPHEKALAALKLDADSGFFDEVEALLAQAYRIGVPCAVFGESHVESSDGAGVVIDGVAFEGELAAEKLKEVHRVFPYVASCGVELAGWADASADDLLAFYANAFNQHVVGAMAAEVRRRVSEESGFTKLASVNPGSLPKWPVTQQIPLFRLLGGVTGDIGVSLTDSCLMVPVKSVSGILFPTEVDWYNCMRCKRKDCPNRRAENIGE